MSTKYLEGGIDVSGTPSSGQVPVWNSTTNRWETGSSGFNHRADAEGNHNDFTVVGVGGLTAVTFPNAVTDDPENLFNLATGEYNVPEPGWYFFSTTLILRHDDVAQNLGAKIVISGAGASIELLTTQIAIAGFAKGACVSGTALCSITGPVVTLVQLDATGRATMDYFSAGVLKAL